MKKTFAEIPNDLINITDTLNQIETQEEEKAETYVQMEELCVKLIDNKEVLDKIEDLLSVFDIDDINNQKSKIDEKLSILEKAENDLETTQELIKENEKKITLLDEVPCGDQFRSCKFIKDASETKEELPNLFKVLENYKEELTKHQKEFEELDKDKIDSYIEKHQAILEKKNKLEKDTLKIDSQHKGLENNLLLLENNLSSLFLQKEEYEQNKEAIENKEQLKKDINGFVGDIQKKTLDREECQKKVMSYYKDHGSLEEKIRSLQEQKQELSELHEEYTAYDLFMNCVHSNGIAYDIIKRKLPVINSEIAKILANIVDFSIFFEADNRRLKIFIQHARHEPRPLEIGSGAEKTIAAMAIRLAFLTVSSLPRSDIFILDEPGTALDEENMEGFVSILDLIKSYFKTIILISHLESLKDCVDSHISIEKKEGFAFVQEV